MSLQKQQKLCKTCEGKVDFDVIFCPFCGTDLLEENACLFEEETVSSRSLSYHHSSEETVHDHHFPLERPSCEEGLFFFPFVLLSIASWLFTLSCLLFIFSENGQLLLFFDAKLWFLYLFFSIPLGVLGWRFLEKREER